MSCISGNLTVKLAQIQNLDAPAANSVDVQPRIAMAKFSEVQGGGSLILAWQVRNKNVLVIGGGEVYTLSFPYAPHLTELPS